MRAAKYILCAVTALCASVSGAAENSTVNPTVTYKGAGWIQFGRIEHSSDTLSGPAETNFNKNWIQNTGGQISAAGKISENWEGGLGLGAIQVSNSRGSLTGAHTWSNSWNPFVTEARVTYTKNFDPEAGSSSPAHKLQVTLGSFPYVYNADVKNFGMYLTRGQVYPGTIFSGFETKHVQPTAATQVGAMVRYQSGGFKNDVLLNSETETKPYFDLSLANIASYQVTPWLEIGGGVNFYRFLPQNAEVTSPGKGCEQDYSASNLSDGNDLCYIMVSGTTTVPDSINGGLDTIPKVDTITGSMSGTKLMGRFRLDPKLLLGWSGIGGLAFGKQDLVLYGEVALIGLKNYPKYYEDRLQRMPVMIGLNLPAFGLLDKFCLEVEYYGSKNFPDYAKAETNASWVPRSPGTNPDNSRNDWKWSLYGSRVLMGHLRIAGQVANDHLFVPSPPAASDPDWAEALTTPKDWYWMLKLAYFF
jgi:hypothetical protein